MSDEKQSAEEIQAELERTRAEMTATVDELAARLDPKVHLNNAKDGALNVVSNVGDGAKKIADDASKGDLQAIGILAGAAVALIGGIALRITRRRR